MPRRWWGLLVLGCIVAGAPAAWAGGPGDYNAQGENYSGVAAITQTGKGTWRIRWEIGGETYSGIGIGDGRTLAFSFTGKSGSGTALYVENATGGYDGIWAYRPDKAVSIETLTPR